MELNQLKRDPSRPLNDVPIPPRRQGSKPPLPPPPPLPPRPQRQEEQHKRKWYHFCYDKQKKTCCDRSCTSWLSILAYSIFYLIFLCTFTMILLYISLCIIKRMEVYKNDPVALLFYHGPSSIGLTVTPTAVNKMSLISYKDTDSSDYFKYVNVLENVVRKRRSDVIKQLGPCGVSPFGFGEAPCVIVRINRHFGLSELPIKPEGLNSSNIPRKVMVMAKQASKLWLHCSGNGPYDTEHIGTVKYYPDPPGFDPGTYAPGNATDVGLIGVQFLNFTKGLALAVQCSLYYEGGKSTVDFVIYVSSSRKIT